MVVSVLFAREDSIYKTLGCDVWDEKRNALNFTGDNPVIAHPPCRLWGQMRFFSTAPESEKQLAYFAVEQVRKNGGILEHPASSTLWEAANLPAPGKRDAFGGWTLFVSQWWFGHKADKPTRLYIVGIEPEDLPPIPFRIGEPEYTCSQSRNRQTTKREIKKAEREHTPRDFAVWLIEAAKKVQKISALSKAEYFNFGFSASLESLQELTKLRRESRKFDRLLNQFKTDDFPKKKKNGRRKRNIKKNR